MSFISKPTATVSYSTNGLNRFYAKDDDSSIEYLIGHEVISTSESLPIYLDSETISYNREGSKHSLADDITSINTTIASNYAEHMFNYDDNVINMTSANNTIAALTTQLNTNTTTVEAILNTSTADLDSFAEVVADYSANGTTLQSNIDTESAARIAADGVLTSDLSTLRTEYDATVIEVDTTITALDTAITNNYNTQQADDGVLTNDLSTLRTEYDATVVDVGTTIAALDTAITNNYNTQQAAETASLNSRQGQLLSFMGGQASKLIYNNYPFSYGNGEDSKTGFGMMIPCMVKLKRFCYSGTNFSGTYTTSTVIVFALYVDGGHSGIYTRCDFSDTLHGNITTKRYANKFSSSNTEQIDTEYDALNSNGQSFAWRCVVLTNYDELCITHRFSIVVETLEDL